jgi:hypothetical protein
MPDHETMHSKRLLEHQKRIGVCDAYNTIMKFIASKDFGKITKANRKKITTVSEQLSIFRDDS